MLKKDRNEELEKILEQKKIDEQARNLLQGILYKVEVSYKDYKKVKVKKQTEEKYVKEILSNINKRCNKISIVKLSQKATNDKIQKELEKNKFYVGDEIISYPIEERILYAIEKKSRFPKILNNKYEEATIAISDLINTGKNMDRTEVLRDFNGWSWTTINKEIENIHANLIYQTLQIILGEAFLENWCQDRDGIIDYLEQFVEETTKKYGEDIANQQKELLIKIAIASSILNNSEFAQQISGRIQKINEEISAYENTEQKIIDTSNNKKQLLQELNKVEKILSQNSKLKEEYEKRNEEAPIGEKIFNIKKFKKQIENRKQQLIEEIDQASYLLNPANYLEEKKKLLEQKQKLENMELSKEQIEELLVEFINNFLKCFGTLIKNTTNEEKIIELIYKFRYFMLLPFNSIKSIKDLSKIKENIEETEKKLIQKAKQKKVISDVPFDVMKHVFETRIIILEDLYYKIRSESKKYFVQIFDENISEEKFEIETKEKLKINKKIKIFI